MCRNPRSAVRAIFLDRKVVLVLRKPVAEPAVRVVASKTNAVWTFAAWGWSGRVAEKEAFRRVWARRLGDGVAPRRACSMCSLRDISVLFHLCTSHVNIHTVNGALIGPVVANPLPRPIAPVAAFDPAGAHKVPYVGS